VIVANSRRLGDCFVVLKKPLVTGLLRLLLPLLVLAVFHLRVVVVALVAIVGIVVVDLVVKADQFWATLS
jgi:hypothetical protein